ncbi:hypothetical protein LAZ67_22001583 [Cordylochernes scorpioides]|uniref:Uncharacterized protein n=1 Tax=Cordylochernes scorpioides TaxID=51811 RepID=A0ABY6LP65_9ARAC|nr:hypothetical protein LAZ67_22001583 [Cordylochernes scorpioides]
MTKASAPPAVRVAPSTQPPSTTTPNPAEALHSELREAGANTYYVALIIVAIIATITGLAFFTLLAVLLRRQATAKASISRPPASESAYDNPTYKVTPACLDPDINTTSL